MILYFYLDTANIFGSGLIIETSSMKRKHDMEDVTSNELDYTDQEYREDNYKSSQN